MEEKKKGSKDSKKIDDKGKKPGAASAHTTPAKPKRPFSEVANSSAEELTLLAHQIEDMSSELKSVKESVSKILTKDDMKTFIKTTVEEIMTEIYKGIDLQIETKLREHSKTLNKTIADLKKENDLLKTENHTLHTKLKTAQNQVEATEKRSQLAVKMANYNEQYSRKNNIKIMNMEEKPDETENSLTSEMCKLLSEKCAVDLNPREIQAIHRIPGKTGSPKPVLVKLFNNNSKTKIMKVRSDMKTAGHRLVDDVTKMNAKLISELLDHTSIDSAWYFNGSVFGKTKGGKRVKFDLYDDIDSVITKETTVAAAPPPTPAGSMD